MTHTSEKIYIIGAGISGLIAALTLEEKGFHPILLEASDAPGGRVKTDSEDGINFDHGFQVLLTAYPQAKKHLDYKALMLKYFKPGALIFTRGSVHRIGDPLRDPGSLVPTLFSPVGTLSDKWKIFRLSQTLRKKSISEIFNTPEKSTLEYLQGEGFSDRIIRSFFRPFFAGIFLEDALKTSSRMFEFVFKMFSEGYAALPEKGIGAISAQLAGRLEKSELRINQPVEKVQGGSILLENGDILPADATLVTVPMDPETGELHSEKVKWKRCDNLYFTVEKRTFPEGIIGLVAEEASLVNNLHYLPGQSLDGKPVLSVTVVKGHELDAESLVKRVSQDLETYCGIKVVRLLRHFPIEQALPDLSGVQMTLPSGTPPVMDKVYLAGDYLLNGSLNAAMASGERAATQLIRDLD